MSYVKNTWASGDLITAQKLNNIENGVESASAAALPVYAEEDSGKYLGVVGASDSLELDWVSVQIPPVLPVYTTEQRGDCLVISSGGDSLQWEAIPKELPEFGVSDEGSFLMINNQGSVTWSSRVDLILPACDTDGWVLVVDSNQGVKWKDPAELIS